MPDPPHSFGGYCRDVEVLDEGTHRDEAYTLADLHDIARNFQLGVGIVDPPVVIGHEEDQPLVAGLAENSGSPAIGWVTALRVARRKGADGKTRPVLLADLHHVHPQIAALVNARAYRKVSPEIYDEDSYPEDAPPVWRGKALRRLALLGGQLPAIKTLRDLPPVRFASRVVSGQGLVVREDGGSRSSANHYPLTTNHHRRALLRRLGRARTADGRGWRVFSEVTPMADDTGGGAAPDLESVVDDLITAQPVLLTPDIVATLTPETKAAIAATLTPEGAGGEGGEAPVAGEGAAMAPAAGMPMAEADMPSRDQMMQDLVALGEDQDKLDAMTDDDLMAMWQEKKGAPMSEPTPKKKGAPAGAVTFAEARTLRLEVRRARSELAAVRADLAAGKLDARRRAAAERRGAVKAYCERWLREGFVTPAEVDAGSTTPNVYHRLMNADGVRVKKYGEGGPALSDFDAAVSEIESRGPGWARRNTRERIPDPDTAPGAKGNATVSADRRRELLKYTESGRAILREEDAAARRNGK